MHETHYFRNNLCSRQGKITSPLSRHYLNSVKNIFLYIGLLKNNNSANRGHFSAHLTWRQKLINWCTVVLLLNPVKYIILYYYSIWYGMPICQSVRLWKPFFLILIYWWIKIQQRGAIMPWIRFDVKTWEISVLQFCIWFQENIRF